MVQWVIHIFRTDGVANRCYHFCTTKIVLNMELWNFFYSQTFIWRKQLSFEPWLIGIIRLYSQKSATKKPSKNNMHHLSHSFRSIFDPIALFCVRHSSILQWRFHINTKGIAKYGANDHSQESIRLTYFILMSWAPLLSSLPMTGKEPSILQ